MTRLFCPSILPSSPVAVAFPFFAFLRACLENGVHVVKNEVEFTRVWSNLLEWQASESNRQHPVPREQGAEKWGFRRDSCWRGCRAAVVGR